jgi:mannose-1-phosphate guanylyltransferase
VHQTHPPSSYWGWKLNAPKTHYGYMQWTDDQGSISNDHYWRGIRKVTTFAEKPDAQNRSKFFAMMVIFLWNTGIFSATLSTLLESLNLHLPETHAPVSDYRTALGQILIYAPH